MNDVQPVYDSDVLLRRVLDREDYVEWHADEGRWIPSLAGVRFDPDGMSTFVERLLHEFDAEVEQVAMDGRSHSSATVFSVVAEAVRRLDFGVEHTPNSESEIGCAHSSIMMPHGLTKDDQRALRNDLAAQMTLAFGVITKPSPEGA